MKQLALVGVAVLCSPGAAFAQAQIVPSNGIKGAETTDARGWAPFLGITATLSLADNSSVVGQVDGFSTLFGLGLTGGADYAQDRHLLRTQLSINEGFARTPVIDEFVKTNDVAKLEGLYNYFLTPDFGLYGRLGIATDLFSATDIRAVPTSWVETVPGGMPIPLTTNGSRQRLTGAFSPFPINEQVGGFAEPVRETWLNLSVRAGLGGRHTFADGVLVNADDKATPQVELTALHDVHQLGFEVFGGGTGKLDGGKALYKAGLSVLLPLVNNDAADRSAVSLTRVGFEGALTFNVYSWMGLVYNLNVIRDPQLFSRGWVAIRPSSDERGAQTRGASARVRVLSGAPATGQILCGKVLGGRGAVAHRQPSPRATNDGAELSIPEDTHALSSRCERSAEQFDPWLR